MKIFTGKADESVLWRPQLQAWCWCRENISNIKVLWQQGLWEHLCSTDSVHRGAERQEALFDKLVQGLVVVSLDLWHHITGDQTHSAPQISSVEAIGVFVTVNLSDNTEVAASTVGMGAKKEIKMGG